MRVASLRRGRVVVACAGFLAVGLAPLGCGSSGSSSNTAPVPLKEKEAIVAALPPGVTLDSPIEPNPMLGANSRNVEDALASLQAYVRDGKLIDGGLGHEIRFDADAGARPAAGPKPAKARGGSVPSTVIKLKH